LLLLAFDGHQDAVANLAPSAVWPLRVQLAVDLGANVKILPLLSPESGDFESNSSSGKCQSSKPVVKTAKKANSKCVRCLLFRCDTLGKLSRLSNLKRLASCRHFNIR
jgi:hypothetical protein